MLNSYSVTPKVDARTTNNYDLDFNAVSGTLCRSHPKSIFVWFQRDSETSNKLMGAEPVYRFDSTKKYSKLIERSTYVKNEEPAMILQMMLTREDIVIAEIVRVEDFVSAELPVEHRSVSLDE